MHSLLSVKFTSLSLNSQTCTLKFAKNKNTIKETWDGIKTIITSTRSINPEIPQLKFNGLNVGYNMVWLLTYFQIFFKTESSSFSEKLDSNFTQPPV